MANSKPTVHAVIPLSILEALRSSDTPDDTGVDELSTELASKRLGMSPTIAAQIARYGRLFRRGGRVDVDEVTGLLKLVERRTDADRVVAEAGRRTAHHAAPPFKVRVARPLRAVPLLGRPLCVGMARRAARRFLSVEVRSLDDGLAATAGEAAGSPIGPMACDLYEAALGELFRVLTSIGDALVHVTCRARGEERCRWEAAVGGAARSKDVQQELVTG